MGRRYVVHYDFREVARPAPSEAEVAQAVRELCALRDELFLAGFDVPMPTTPDWEATIRRIVAHHRAEALRDAGSEFHA